MEPTEKRAPVWHPLTQRFRLLQEVNNLRVISNGVGIPLLPEERQVLITRLEQGDLPIKELRKTLGLHRSAEFNLDRGGKKAIHGNRTAAKLRSAFGPRWDDLTLAAQLTAITDLASGLSDESLAAKARDHWGLNELQADLYSSLVLEDAYSAFSLRAMEKMLPALEQGCEVATARKQHYAESFRTAILPGLPPVVDQLKEIRNPAVLRALTELRKIANALIRRYGKPAEIHIELARDLKASRDEREERWKRMRRNEKERESAASGILKETGLSKPSGRDLEKWRLADECGWTCPYTGRAFSKMQLMHSGEIQVEHIIPFSLSLDDSFANKTLAYSSINAIKGNRSPVSALAHRSDWDEILERVKTFKGDFAKAKLRRFQLTESEVNELLENFTQRQLNDTRYASRLAARYLSCLYGGLSDEQQKQRIFVSPGGVTAHLRRLWSVEGLLRQDGVEKKTRDDHRHHALDAAVIALTGPRAVKLLSDSAARATSEGHRRFASIPAPWDGFAADLAGILKSVVISYRVDRKVGAAMHDAMHYGIVQSPQGLSMTVKRKPVHLLSPKELDEIVDPAVALRVRLQLGRLGGDIKKLEHNPATLPASGGREIPIRKVRIRYSDQPRTVGKAARQRNVIGGEFHHFEIVERTDSRRGKSTWDVVPVSMQEAMERIRRGQSVINRDHGEFSRFAYSLAKGEVLKAEENGVPVFLVVKALEASTNRIGLQRLTDARPYSAENKNRERAVIGTLREKLKAQKVVVTPLGEVHACRD